MRNGRYCGTDGPTSYPNNYFGYGKINVMQAVNVCKQFCANAENGIVESLEGTIPEFIEESSLMKK